METRLTNDPDATLAQFMEAHGPGIASCYMRWPLRFSPWCERFWEFWDDGRLVGWGSIRDEGDGVYSFRLGVWPDAANRGYRLQMRTVLVNAAFENPRCRAVQTSAQLSNPGQAMRLINAALPGGFYSSITGAQKDPPRVGVEITREHWESQK